MTQSGTMTVKKNRLAQEPGLYVTATPIGNLGDITYRAVEILKAADLILCEDTRQTAKLCAAYGIKTPRSPYHDHNAARVRPGIIKKLQDGAMICLVSDAGTPLISDPGFKLVRDARMGGIAVFPVPGPAAAIAALSAAGAPSDQFFFAGFLPAKAGARDKALSALTDIVATLIFYETAPRLTAALSSMTAILGDRRASVARELTKMHEEFRSGMLSELTAHYAVATPKGELVVVVFPPEKAIATTAELDAFLNSVLSKMTLKEAVAKAAAELGITRNQAYARALFLKDAN